MRDTIQIGDEITTIGGIIGEVVSIKDDFFIIESPADHSKIKLLRAAIQTNNTVHEEATYQDEWVLSLLSESLDTVL